MKRSISRALVVIPVLALLVGVSGPVAAAPEGTITWGVHITLASRWLDPAETEGIITPFMVLYALHDAPSQGGWLASEKGLYVAYALTHRRRPRESGQALTARSRGTGSSLIASVSPAATKASSAAETKAQR